MTEINLLAVINRAEGKLTSRARTNAKSVAVAIEGHGARVGLDQPHRLALYMGQISHESMGFTYDREVWGPTPAQKRYDTRTDLGNTPERDGDGKKYAGHTAGQITGKANTREFRDWCRQLMAGTSLTVPDFVASPEMMNTDPWEGLGPIWYWDSRNLNRYADSGDIEMITKRINGGLNGYQDRIYRTVRYSLVFLGRDPADVRGFQKSAGLDVDGVAGPKTRAALHKALVALTAASLRSGDTRSAPVIEETTVEKPVVPQTVEKAVKKNTGIWQWVTGVFSSGALGLGWLAGMDWQAIAAIGGVVIVFLIVILVMRRQIIGAVKDIKSAVEGGAA